MEIFFFIQYLSKKDQGFLSTKPKKQNLFKNMSKGPPFLWQTQIQMIEYGLNDTI